MLAMAIFPQPCALSPAIWAPVYAQDAAEERCELAREAAEQLDRARLTVGHAPAVTKEIAASKLVDSGAAVVDLGLHQVVVVAVPDGSKRDSTPIEPNRVLKRVALHHSVAADDFHGKLDHFRVVLLMVALESPSLLHAELHSFATIPPAGPGPHLRSG